MFKVGIVISVKLAGYVSDVKKVDLLLYIGSGQRGLECMHLKISVQNLPCQSNR